MKHFMIFFLSGMVVLLLVANLFAQGPDTLWTKTFGDSLYKVRKA